MNERRETRPACPEYADRLVDLSDGELPADSRTAVAAHVATCDGCRAELGRLNSSLTVLRGGIIAASMLRLPQRRQKGRQLVLIGIGSTAAAIALAIGIASLLNAPAGGRNEISMPNHAPAPNTLTTGQGFEGQGFESGGSITAEDAFRRIALVEQQARLETSLALMPDEPWYADQRAANEELLSTFRKATMAAGAVDHSPNQTPETKGTL